MKASLRKPTLVLLGMCLLIFIAGALIYLSNKQSTIEEVDNLLKQHKTTGAILTLRKALQSNEKDVLLRLRLGQIYLERKNYESAVANFEQVLSQEPANHQARIGLAKAKFNSGNYDGIDNILTPSDHEPPVEKEARELLGQVFLRQGRFSEAKTCFELLLAESADNGPAHLGLWTIASLQNNYADDSHLSMAAASQDRTVSSLATDLKAALDKNKIGGEAGYYNALLGTIYLKHTEIELARQFFEYSLSQNPNRPDVAAYLGLSQLYLDDSTAAVATLEKTATTYPTNTLALHSLGLALRSEKKYENARVAFARALEITPDDAVIRADLALNLALTGDYSGAERLYADNAENHPEDIQSQLALARFYLDRGFHLDAGLRAADKAYSLNSRDGDILAIYGWALYLNNDSANGESFLRRSLDITEDSSQAHHYLGVLLENKQDYEGAFQEFQTAAALDPDKAIGQRSRQAIDDLTSRYPNLLKR